VWPASRYARARAAGERLPRRLVVLTFDDGLANTVRTAAPSLRAQGFPASVFVVTDNIGRAPDWYRRDASAIGEQLRAMYRHGAWSPDRVAEATANALAEPLADWPELLAARQHGLEILSHSASHPFLDRLSPDALRDELQRSRAALRAHGCDEPALLAWPYGASSEAAERVAAECGFVAAFRSEPGPEPSLLALGRTPVDPRLGVFGVAFALGRGSRVWLWLQRWRRGRHAR
jgi:peptidoglycan/xylan/chitin deacetylase (PgdA/CDA1 family)